MNSTLIHVRAFAVSALMCFTYATHADDPYSGEPGSLDLHFGEWGLGMATLPGDHYDVASDFALDADGNIVAAGTLCDIPDREGCYPALMRFDAAGRRAPGGSWGEHAIVVLGDVTGDEIRVTVAPDGDGGWWASWQEQDSLQFVRLDQNGDFHAGLAPGNVTFDESREERTWLHQAPSEHLFVILALKATTEEMPAIHVSRRHAADGLPDLSYGDSGSFTLPLADGDEVISSDVLDDGRVMILVQNWRTNAARIYAVRADGSGLALDFGAGVRHLLDVLDECGINADTVIAAGFGLTDAEDIRVGFTFFDGSKDRAGVLALNILGHRVTTYGGNGCALHAHPAEIMFPTAFALNGNGDAAMSVWSDLAQSDSLLHFIADGGSDARYDGDGSSDDVRLPGGAIRSFTGLKYDAAGGLLATDYFDLEYAYILGINGFGVMRFLAADESRIYDPEPNQVDDSTHGPMPPGGTTAFYWNFPGRDTAIRVSITNGQIGLVGQDWNFSVEVVIPLGVIARLVHQGADVSGDYSESLVSAGEGPMIFRITSGTVEDREPETLVFDPVEGAAPGTFVFSTPAGLWGVDVPIDISVENGCYFLFASGDDVPDEEEWPNVLTQENCRTEPGTATAGQVVFLGHVSADTPETVKTTTFRYGLGVSTFQSTTTAGSTPPDNEPDDFVIPDVDDTELDQDVVIGPIALTGFDTAFAVGDTMNAEMARIEVSTDGESWMGAVEISPGDALWLRVRSADTPATVLTGELYVGSTDNRKTFTVTTRVADPGGPNEPPVPDDPDNSDSGGGPLGPLLLSALLAVPLLRRSR